MKNYEFLNENFGTNYSGYMRCGWNYSKDILILMLRFDESVKNGWKNIIVDNETVYENYVGDLKEQLPSHYNVREDYRLLVDKANNYRILGLYKYDRLNSNERTKRIWRKVANSLGEFLITKEK